MDGCWSDVEAFVCGQLGASWSSRDWVEPGKLAKATSALNQYIYGNLGIIRSFWDLPGDKSVFECRLGALATLQLGQRELVYKLRSALPPESIEDLFPPIRPEMLGRQHDGYPYLLPIPNSQGGLNAESLSLTLTQVDNDPMEVACLGGFPANWKGFLQSIYTGKFFGDQLMLVQPTTGEDGKARRTLRIGVAPNPTDFHKNQDRVRRESRNLMLRQQRELGARLLNLARFFCLPDLGFPWQMCEFAFITPDNWQSMNRRTDSRFPGKEALEVRASGVLSLLLNTAKSPDSHNGRDDGNPNQPLLFVNAE